MRTRLLFLMFAIMLYSLACTQMRYARTNIGQALNSPVTTEFPWGEVYCGQGVVCAEVEVVRLDFDNRMGGEVQVTLHNRTGDTVAVQISLEILSQNGTRLDSTTFQDVPLPPRQEGVWKMPGIYQPNSRIRVLLRARS